MSLRIRRGLNSERTTKVLDTGEIAWTTDTKKLYVGDGSTTGGVNILANSVDSTSGLAWDNTTQKIKYTGALGSAISNVVEDTSPELGGDLNLNNKTINGTGTINFTGNITASALSLTTGLGANLPLNSRNITGTGNIDITGNLSATGTLIATTGLGANLPLNSRNITGTGNIDITGNLSASGTLTATTGLGANLPLNSRNITGTGNINITGNITASGLVTASSGATISGVLTASTITPNLEGNTLLIKSTNQIPLSIQATTSGVRGGGVPQIQLSVSKGTLAAPTNNSAGDLLGGFAIAGYYNGSVTAAGMTAAFDPVANFSSNAPASYIYWYAGNNNNGQIMTFYGLYGTLSSPLTKTNVYSQSGVVITATDAQASGGTATITFATQSFPPFNINDTITLSGFTPNNFNGQFAVISCTITTVTFALIGTYSGSVFGTITGTFTVLPSAVSVGQGARAFVSDATSNSFGSGYTSGGSYAVPVYSDGAAWHIG
jgi:hypothetical protein